MKLAVRIAVVLLLACASSAHAAMTTMPYLGPSAPADAEPNRLTNNPRARDVDPYAPGNSFNPYYSLVPMAPAQQPQRRRSGPGFLNADPFDPNSIVNRYDRDRYANPYPYDPIFNPYGQGSSLYAPGGGPNVPMGNGIPWSR
jgi:hypothetical protein